MTGRAIQTLEAPMLTELQEPNKPHILIPIDAAAKSSSAEHASFLCVVDPEVIDSHL